MKNAVMSFQYVQNGELVTGSLNLSNENDVDLSVHFQG